jgi:outer membrane lipoprotein LolB
VTLLKVFANALFQKLPNTPNDHIPLRQRRLPDRVSLLFLALILTGCATTRSVDLPDLPNWETREAVLGQMSLWEFAGRIGVSAGTEGFNGKLWWRQDGPVFRARISGPLGIGTVFINGNGPELTVTDNDGVVTRLEDAETDLRQLYGWTIPVKSLRYWALGIPDPATPAGTTFEDPGQLVQISQGGWLVDIGQYREAAGQSMPRRLTAASGDVKVRLVIDDWTFRK